MALGPYETALGWLQRRVRMGVEVSGVYLISVSFDGAHVAGSPFRITADPPPSPRRASSPGRASVAVARGEASPAESSPRRASRSASVRAPRLGPFVFVLASWS